MPTLALTPAALQKLLELINTLVPGPTETVVLTNDLQDCYPGLDGAGAAQPVVLDVSGSFTLPVGVSMVIEVKKLDPLAGTFTDVPCTVSVDPTAGTTTVTIQPGDHGVKAGCANFLIYFIATYPGTPPKRKIILIKAFQVCDKCPKPDTKPPQPMTKGGGKKKK